MGADAVLELEHVSKSCASRAGSFAVLDDISLSIGVGELVVVWGARRSGRSTLLRVAAGIETPDSGVVRFRERDRHGVGPPPIGSGVAFCRRRFSPGEGRTVFDQLLAGQEAIGVPRSLGVRRVHGALSRAGVDACEMLQPEALDGSEHVRVAIARALSVGPELLVIDDPTIGADFTQRDAILALLRSIADEGVSVLATTGETPCLSYATRALTISRGRLRGALTPETATVVQLRREPQPAA